MYIVLFIMFTHLRMAWCIFVKITELKCTSRLSHCFIYGTRTTVRFSSFETLKFNKNFLIVFNHPNLSDSFSLSFSLFTSCSLSIRLPVHLSNLNMLQDFTNYKKFYSLNVNTCILIHSFDFWGIVLPSTGHVLTCRK